MDSVKKSPFDFVTSILQSNTHLDDLSGYNQFLTNRALSYNADTLSMAVIANKSTLTDQQHYDMLFYGIRKFKRPRTKWGKAVANEDVDILSQYYQCNRKKAEQLLRVHTKDQINNIHAALSQGGDKSK